MSGRQRLLSWGDAQIPTGAGDEPALGYVAALSTHGVIDHIDLAGYDADGGEFLAWIGRAAIVPGAESA